MIIIVLNDGVLIRFRLTTNAGNADNSNLLEDVYWIFKWLVKWKFNILSIQILKMNSFHFSSWLLSWTIVWVLKAKASHPHDLFLVLHWMVDCFRVNIWYIVQFYSRWYSYFMWEYFDGFQSKWHLKLQNYLLRVGAKLLWTPTVVETAWSAFVLQMDCFIVSLHMVGWMTWIFRGTFHYIVSESVQSHANMTIFALIVSLVQFLGLLSMEFRFGM